MSEFFYIINFGCKLNIYEAESINYELISAGWKEASSIEEAALIIINTCTVTGKADSKCRNAIRKSRRANPKAALIVCGCLVNADRKQLEELSEVDIFIENKNKDRISSIIQNPALFPVKNRPFFYTHKTDGTFEFHTPVMPKHSRAFVKIQDGCDNYCSYCKIPYARGENRSRPLDHILFEIEKITQNGYNEIVLTGINIGSYSEKKTGFAHLLHTICETFPELRIRLSSIEPQYVNDEVLTVLKNSAICPHFHIPLQSGSDPVLKAMNRLYGVDEFTKVIETVRKTRENPYISTDLILGFPGETEQDFENTRLLIEQIGFSYIHLFGFSPRKGTKAFSMTPRVPERIRDERVAFLQKVMKEHKYAYEKLFENKIVQVLIERKKEGYYRGKSEQYLDLIIETDLELSPKKIYPVKITSVSNNTIKGTLV